MKARFSGALLVGGWMAAIAGAYPVEGLDRPPQTRTVHLTFWGATSSYSIGKLAVVILVLCRRGSCGMNCGRGAAVSE